MPLSLLSLQFAWTQIQRPVPSLYVWPLPPHIRHLSGLQSRPRLTAALLCFCISLLTPLCHLAPMDVSANGGRLWRPVDTHVLQEVGRLQSGEVPARFKGEEEAGGGGPGLQPHAGY